MIYYNMTLYEIKLLSFLVRMTLDATGLRQPTPRALSSDWLPSEKKQMGLTSCVLTPFVRDEFQFRPGQRREGGLPSDGSHPLADS